MSLHCIIYLQICWGKHLHPSPHCIYWIHQQCQQWTSSALMAWTSMRCTFATLMTRNTNSELQLCKMVSIPFISGLALQNIVGLYFEFLYKTLFSCVLLDFDSWPTKPKILTIWHFTGKVVNPWNRLLLSPFYTGGNGLDRQAGWLQRARPSPLIHPTLPPTTTQNENRHLRKCN